MAELHPFKKAGQPDELGRLLGGEMNRREDRRLADAAVVGPAAAEKNAIDVPADADVHRRSEAVIDDQPRILPTRIRGDPERPVTPLDRDRQSLIRHGDIGQVGEPELLLTAALLESEFLFTLLLCRLPILLLLHFAAAIVKQLLQGDLRLLARGFRLATLVDESPDQ